MSTTTNTTTNTTTRIAAAAPPDSFGAVSSLDALLEELAQDHANTAQATKMVRTVKNLPRAIMRASCV